MASPHFTKTHPEGLPAPDRIRSELQSKTREQYILRHGFSEAQIGPEWWSERGVEITFPTLVEGSSALTRGDLFEMSDAVATDHNLLEFLWHVLAWGSGRRRLNNRERLRSIPDHVPILWEAFEFARTGDYRRAYGLLVKPGRATVPFFGPAFFTKFLYFSSATPSEGCLILDARVSRVLFKTGWGMSPGSGSGGFSYNWYTDTYVSYCGLLHGWADSAGTDISADMFERALFEAAG